MLRMREEGRNLYQVTIDGTPRPAFKPDRGQEGNYTLAEGLPPGVHDVEIVKRTDGDLGEGVFMALTADGPLEEPAPPLQRRIEFLGDSITTGYGVESSNPICERVSDNENETASYAALVARDLAADHRATAWSGKTVAEILSAFDRTLPGRLDRPFDLSTWVPDAVVINLGTNNFALFDPGEAKFVAQYTTLVRRVRDAYPKAHIVCVLGPMLTDSYPVGRKNLTHARRYMKRALSVLEAAGETNIDFIEVDEQKHTDGLGCGFHPSKRTHKRMADRIAPRIKEKLGW